MTKETYTNQGDRRTSLYNRPSVIYTFTGYSEETSSGLPIFPLFFFSYIVYLP